ncbi:unnamed protein product [Scytosiphon promiscuus]
MSDMLAVTEGVREYVEAKTPRRWVVLMLHSSLSVEEQDKVFDASPLGTRKMILATNIAETSVTIDGVRFVCDSGKAKEMSWDPTSGVRSLQEFWVSRASAEQRKGRAGRTGPGTCFRLYARDTFDRLPPFAEPEIRRCPLEGLVLQMKSLGLDDPRYFPYLSPPPPENLRSALESLALLGATDVAAATPSPQPAEGGVPPAPPPPPPLSPPPSTTPTTAFHDATARAPLTPLGRVLSALPVDPSVGKMLALGALFGENEHVLTLAAALSTQTPFDARAAASASGANPVAEFASPNGDPFTVMNAYDEWIRVKAARQESSRRWCKRHGLQEQRLYEITKLRRQFQDLLDKLRELKMKRGGRKRKVLQVDHGDGEGGTAGKGSGGDGLEEGGDVVLPPLTANHTPQCNKTPKTDQLAESSGRRLARRDVAILKAILCQGLYPHFAVADAGNSGRPSNEQQYVTRPSGGLFMSPSSVLACQDFAAADRGRGDGLLCYGQLMETQRPFVSSVTPLPALQSLLLFSARVDTSEDASLMLFDHWLLVEMRGRNPALTGQKLLVVACGLRARLEALLSGALVEAERRKRGGGTQPHGGADRQQQQHRRQGQEDPDPSSSAEGELLPQDLPPLLLMARRAWIEGEQRGVEDVDWAKEAEDLSIDLAEFMLQSIGYDVKAVPPRRVEALLVDALRLRDLAEVRRVLRGHRTDLTDKSAQGPPSTAAGREGDGGGKSGSGGMPELLAAMSRAIEDEIRGNKGLFGLDSGVLERLKGGVRVTPFLRHGSVRRPDSAGAAPHGLAAGGMKKWWRCPRCHISQVVDLEAIHEHFKVCLADPAPVGGNGSDPGDTAKNGSKKVQQEATAETKRRRRMVGTSVKKAR